MTYFYEDAEGMRAEVLKPNSFVYNVFLDNIHLGSPQRHAFAGVLVPKDLRARFIAELAKAMELDVTVTDVPTRPEVAVTVFDNTTETWYTPGENKYTISGDIDDILSDEEALALYGRWGKLELENNAWTSNYYVQDLLTHGLAGGFVNPIGEQDFEFDSEGMCFFAYTSDRAKADDLAAWINGKRFLR